MRAKTLAVVNILDWIVFFVFDIVGDLSSVESIHYSKNNSFHAWIKEIFSYFKASELIVALRYYKTSIYVVHSCQALKAAENNP